MDYNKYLKATLTEQMEMIFKAAQEQQERINPKNYQNASPVDQMTMMVNSIKEEDEKIKSGYYLTASPQEQISYMARQIAEKIKRETEIKKQELEFHLKLLENSKTFVMHKLDLIDKNQENVGNLPEVNALLDKLIFYIKEEIKKIEELEKLQ